MEIIMKELKGNMKYISKELYNALSKKRAFIFDFDGTLSSTDEILYQTLKKLSKKYGHAYTRAEYDLVKGKPSSEFFVQFKSFVKGDVDAKTITKEYIEIFNEITNTQKLRCYKYVKELVKAFPDKVYCVASNNVSEFLEQRINDFGLKDKFKHIFACGTGYMDKNYVYTNIQQLVGAVQNDCVLFEDNQKYLDIAKEKGILGVAIVHKENEGIKADFYIDLRNEE